MSSKPLTKEEQQARNEWVFVQENFETIKNDPKLKEELLAVGFMRFLETYNPTTLSLANMQEITKHFHKNKELV